MIINFLIIIQEKMTKQNIENSEELEFAIFCIENVAVKLGVNAQTIYSALTEKSSILNDYIIPEYEIGC